jgi:hypothetical protein
MKEFILSFGGWQPVLFVLFGSLICVKARDYFLMKFAYVKKPRAKKTPNKCIVCGGNLLDWEILLTDTCRKCLKKKKNGQSKAKH